LSASIQKLRLGLGAETVIAVLRRAALRLPAEQTIPV